MNLRESINRLLSEIKINEPKIFNAKFLDTDDDWEGYEISSRFYKNGEPLQAGRDVEDDNIYVSFHLEDDEEKEIIKNSQEFRRFLNNKGVKYREENDPGVMRWFLIPTHYFNISKTINEIKIGTPNKFFKPIGEIEDEDEDFIWLNIIPKWDNTPLYALIPKEGDNVQIMMTLSKENKEEAEIFRNNLKKYGIEYSEYSDSTWFNEVYYNFFIPKKYFDMNY